MGMVNPSSPSSTFKISENFQHVEENMKGTTFSDFLAAAYFLTSRKCHRILFDRRCPCFSFNAENVLPVW